MRPLRRKKDLFLDFVDSHNIEIRNTPRQLLEAIDDACHEMDASNYHTRLFGIAQEIIRRYCGEHDIPLGPSKKQIEDWRRRRYAKQDRLIAAMTNPDGSIKDDLPAIRRFLNFSEAAHRW